VAFEFSICSRRIAFGIHNQRHLNLAFVFSDIWIKHLFSDAIWIWHLFSVVILTRHLTLLFCDSYIWLSMTYTIMFPIAQVSSLHSDYGLPFVLFVEPLLFERLLISHNPNTVARLCEVICRLVVFAWCPLSNQESASSKVTTTGCLFYVCVNPSNVQEL